MDATRARDHRRRDAQNIPSVQEIVELSQDEPSAHRFRRHPDGTWSFHSADGLDGTLELTSVDLTISLSDIYAGVDFDA